MVTTTKKQLNGMLERLNKLLEQEKTDYRYVLFQPWSKVCIAKQYLGESGVHSMNSTFGTTSQLYDYLSTIEQTLEHYIYFKNGNKHKEYEQ